MKADKEQSFSKVAIQMYLSCTTSSPLLSKDHLEAVKVNNSFEKIFGSIVSARPVYYPNMN